MTRGRGSDRTDGSSAPALVCVVPNPSIDKVGEVDRLEPGAIHRPTDLVAVPGGKGLNVARVALELGMRVAAVVLLAGHAGRWMDAELGRLGLERSVTWAATGETRTCLSILDRSTGRLTEFYEPGPPIRRADWALFARAVVAAARASRSGALVAISGSLPPGVPAEALASLVRSIGRAGRRAVVDAAGPALAAALDARPFLVKVNAAEAGALVARTVESEAEAIGAAAGIVARGAASAVVTRGRHGAVLVGPLGRWAVSAPAGGPYVVGSGDAFLAGLATGLAGDDPPEVLLRRAAATAAASTLVPGQGRLRRADARRLAGSLVVRRLPPG